MCAAAADPQNENSKTGSLSLIDCHQGEGNIFSTALLKVRVVRYVTTALKRKAIRLNSATTHSRRKKKSRTDLSIGKWKLTISGTA
jgi:hypothetical protein